MRIATTTATLIVSMLLVGPAWAGGVNCCIGYGSDCIVTTPQGCNALGGFPVADCQNNCLIRACCMIDETCIDTLLPACFALDGFPFSGQMCDTISCPEFVLQAGPLGACCGPFPNDPHECSMTYEDLCTAFGVVNGFHALIGCSEIEDCESFAGACCLPEGICEDWYYEDYCVGEFVEGVWRGEGTTCGDFNQNGADDTCENLNGPCVADLNGDGNVGVSDLVLLLVQWGECEGGS